MSAFKVNCILISTALCIAGFILAGCQDEILSTSDNPEITTEYGFSENGDASRNHQTNAYNSIINRQLAELRRLTAPYHNFDKAVAAGYGNELTPCLYHSELGGMGYHYANPEYLNDTINLLEPEVLVYEPKPNGELRLVAIEYIIPEDEWIETDPPSLFGQDFSLNENAPEPFYALHVWIWRNNPNGMFFDWNPKVSCEYADVALDVSGMED